MLLERWLCININLVYVYMQKRWKSNSCAAHTFPCIYIENTKWLAAIAVVSSTSQPALFCIHCFLETFSAMWGEPQRQSILLLFVFCLNVTQWLEWLPTQIPFQQFERYIWMVLIFCSVIFFTVRGQTFWHRPLQSVKPLQLIVTRYIQLIFYQSHFKLWIPYESLSKLASIMTARARTSINKMKGCRKVAEQFICLHSNR